MIGLIINGTYADLYGDETIEVTSKMKDVRDISKVFMEFSQSFKLPASPTNNKLFSHYYRYFSNRFDGRFKVKASLEIDSIPFKDGYIKLNSVSLKANKVESYDVTFFGNVVNLSDLFAELTLNDLDFGEYNHVKNATNVQLGLEGNGSLMQDNIIYPLVTKGRYWDQAMLESGNDISYEEFSPAIRVTEVLKTIANFFKISITGSLFTEEHFQHLYLLAQRSLPDTIAELIGKHGVRITYDTSTDEELIYLNGVILSQSSEYLTTITANITAPAGESYTVNWVDIANNSIIKSDNRTGNGTSSVYIDGGQSVVIFIQSSNQFSMDISVTAQTEDIDGYPLRNATATKNGINIIDYTSIFKYKLPEIKVTDFITSLIKQFNLVVESFTGTDFIFTTYDEWRSNGEVKDLTKYIDITASEVITPELPREIQFKYLEPKAVNNNKYFEYNGRGYGDLYQKIDGEDESIIFEPMFENLMFDRLTGSDLMVGFLFDKNDKPVEEVPFLFYWAGDQSANIDLKDMSAISSYKLCNTYYNLAATTHSLNFGAEINTWSLVEESKSLFSQYYTNYITDIFKRARRLHNFKAVLSAPIVYELRLNDVLKLRDDYFVINQITSNLLTKQASLELINIERTPSAIEPPTPVPPDVPVLSIDSKTCDSITVKWNPITSTNPISVIELYRDGTKIKDISPGETSATLTGLTEVTSYDIYIKAIEIYGASATSNTVTESTLKCLTEFTMGIKGYATHSDACKEIAFIQRYHDGTGLFPDVGDTIYIDIDSNQPLIGSDKYYYIDSVPSSSMPVSSNGVAGAITDCNI